MASYGFQDGKPIFSRGDPPRGQIYLLPVGHFSMPSQDQPMHFGDRYATNSRWPNKAWSTPTLVSNCQRSDSRRREPRECLWVPVLISSSTNRRCFLGLKTIKISSEQIRQLHAYVANESTRHLKTFIDPSSILVVFFIDEKSAKGAFLVLYLFSIIRVQLLTSSFRPQHRRSHPSWWCFRVVPASLSVVVISRHF